MRMSWLYRHVTRPLLSLQESEPAHNRTLEALAFALGRVDAPT